MVTKKMGPNMPGVNVAVIVGSNRRDSIKRKLARALVRLAEGKPAASFVQIDDLPMCNGDLESPLRANVARFKAAIEETAALLFVKPEHNSSIPTVLENAIDGGTRPYGRSSWVGKAVAIIGASPGAIGTAIAQQHPRHGLADLRALMMGGEAYVTFKPDLIDETGTVTDAGSRRFLQFFIDQFAGLAAQLTTMPKTYTVAA